MTTRIQISCVAWRKGRSWSRTETSAEIQRMAAAAAMSMKTDIVPDETSIAVTAAELAMAASPPRCTSPSRARASQPSTPIVPQSVPSNKGRPGLQLHLTGDTGDRAAPDPDVTLGVLGDVDARRPPEHGPLAGDVRRLDPPGAEQPLGEAGIEAARRRILHEPALGDERPHLQLFRGAGRVRTGHADVQVDGHRPQPQHGLRAVQQEPQPAGAV